MFLQPLDSTAASGATLIKVESPRVRLNSWHTWVGCAVQREGRPPLGGGALVAAARSDHHVAVFLEDDVGAVVEEEH